MTRTVARPHRLWDAVAAALVLALLFAALRGAPLLRAPVEALTPIALDPLLLPGYALRSTARLFTALALSLALALLLAALTAKSRRARMVLVPVLDVMQSIPVLALLGVAAALGQRAAPGSVGAAELTAVLTIMASQVWTMAFSLDQSFRTLPPEVDEAARSMRLTAWQRFWRVEVPFAVPGLVLNVVGALSGAWFYLVAAEAAAAGTLHWRLPGLGSWVALAVERRDLPALGWAVAALTLLILLYDTVLFRPLAAWSAKFRNEPAGPRERRPWMLRLLAKAPPLRAAAGWVARAAGLVANLPIGPRSGRPARRVSRAGRLGDLGWLVLLGAVGILGMARAVHAILDTVPWREVLHVFVLGAGTLGRVLAAVALASLTAVPLGVWAGLRPGVAAVMRPALQVLSAFPANLVFPLGAALLVRWHGDPDLWDTLLLLLAAQWVVLLNVMAGAQAIPSDLREAARSLGVRGGTWWRRVGLPGVRAYWTTGAVLGAGAAWNASIVAEAASWGGIRPAVHGIGAYIADSTASGDGTRLLLGLFVMSRYVLLVNAVAWQPMQRRAQRRSELG